MCQEWQDGFHLLLGAPIAEPLEGFTQMLISGSVGIHESRQYRSWCAAEVASLGHSHFPNLPSRVPESTPAQVPQGPRIRHSDWIAVRLPLLSQASIVELYPSLTMKPRSLESLLEGALCRKSSSFKETRYLDHYLGSYPEANCFQLREDLRPRSPLAISPRLPAISI